jgi:anti-sigma B factor antagonist
MPATETKDLKLTVAADQKDGVSLFRLSGSLEIANVAEAKELTAPAFEPAPPKILFDLSGIDYIDSAGLGFLIGTLRRANQAEGTVRVCGLSAYLTGVFKIVNLQNILEVFPDEEKALEAFRTAG